MSRGSAVAFLASGKMGTRSSIDGTERAGVHDLHFQNLRHTFGTWLMQAGVDYVVIEKLLGHRLPGTGELYLHDSGRTLAGCSEPIGTVYARYTYG